MSGKGRGRSFGHLVPTYMEVVMKLLVTGVVSAALLVPAGAAARPADVVPATAKPAPVVTVESSGSGFDWGSAGVGAGASTGLMLIAAGSFAGASRFRSRLAR
jgi:hypothetical protein